MTAVDSSSAALVPTGRTEIRSAVDAMDAPPADPRLDAIAHVICVMGGHIPRQDNERRDACEFHRKFAVVALARLEAVERAEDRS